MNSLLPIDIIIRIYSYIPWYTQTIILNRISKMDYSIYKQEFYPNLLTKRYLRTKLYLNLKINGGEYDIFDSDEIYYLEKSYKQIVKNISNSYSFL